MASSKLKARGAENALRFADGAYSFGKGKDKEARPISIAGFGIYAKAGGARGMLTISGDSGDKDDISAAANLAISSEVFICACAVGWGIAACPTWQT